jgi:hypothetical protein
MRILLAGLAAALLGVPPSTFKEPALIATITTGTHPCGVVAAFGSVLARERRRHARPDRPAHEPGRQEDPRRRRRLVPWPPLYRVDRARQRVIDSFPAGPGAFVTLRAYGSMWVTSFAGSDVRRFRP